jgi:hypothetical protein
MIARGETVTYSAEGANIYCVNLSGKKTLAGRSSGECFLLETTKGESRLPVNFQVKGQRNFF